MKSPVWAGYTGILGLLSGTLIASHLFSSPAPESLQRPLASIGSEIAGWRMILPAEHLDPRQFTAMSYLARTYIKNGEELALLVGFYDSHQGAVSVHTPKNCLPGGGWEIWKSRAATLTFDGRPAIINQYQIYRMDRRMTVLYWYQSRNRVNANEYLAKFMLVRDALLEGRTSGSFVRIVIPDKPDVIADGRRFAEGVMQELQVCFRP
jgi:EpsI family protein